MLRETDRFVRFHFPELSIRGAWVHLDETYRALIADRNYPAAVSCMLGEMASVTALMAGQLKHPGRLTFQMRDPGPINLLVMDCTDKLGLRGTAQWDPAFSTQLENPNFQCLNTHGNDDDNTSRLMMTLDAQQFSTPWQSFVPLVGQSLAEAFGHYLAQSEQQPTLLYLAADNTQAAALFLQKMPGADEADADEAGPVVDLRPSPGVERHLHPVPNGSSEVPVADRPVEPTTNRAVALVALLGAVAVGVAVVVVVRRRRR